MYRFGPPSKQDRRPDWIAGIILATLGTSCVVVGGRDASLSLAINSRILGGVILLGGVLLIAAAGGLVFSQSWGLPLGIVASGVGFLIGLYFAGAQVASGDLDARILIWTAAIVLAGFVAARLLLRMHWKELPDAVKHPRVLGIVGAGLAVFTFWYSTEYQPTVLPPSLSIYPSMTVVGQSSKILAVDVHIGIKNTSDTRVRVLDSLLVVLGVSVHPADVSIPSLTTDPNQASFLGHLDQGFPFDTSVLSSATESEPTALSVARFFPAMGWFDPGQEWSTDRIVYVQKSTYDLLDLGVQLFVAQRDQLVAGPELKLPTAYEKDSNGNEFILREWGVEENSWVHQLTR
jgi:hypothetical protein